MTKRLAVLLWGGVLAVGLAPFVGVLLKRA